VAARGRGDRAAVCPPALRFGEEWFADDDVPLRCVVHPERVGSIPIATTCPPGWPSGFGRGTSGTTGCTGGAVDRAGSLYLFTCTVCVERPLTGTRQS
jgi:hypothetical protein